MQSAIPSGELRAELKARSTNLQPHPEQTGQDGIFFRPVPTFRVRRARGSAMTPSAPQARHDSASPAKNPTIPEPSSTRSPPNSAKSADADCGSASMRFHAHSTPSAVLSADASPDSRSAHTPVHSNDSEQNPASPPNPKLCMQEQEPFRQCFRFRKDRPDV